MFGELLKAVLERALEAELTVHLGYERHERGWSGNGRNGANAQTVQTGVGPAPLQVPRDRSGMFEPILVPKRAGRVAGALDDMVISLYAHGMCECFDQLRPDTPAATRLRAHLDQEIRNWIA
jgi:putative transposase